ncbi:hypothetical protein F4813DRAFT_382839 [Daldinia decipiens]|uniref:uncharacterized protein n=1 Tax=Daldinia decipiens TaxID=326647 RepID=UPI0020C56769|nr:uncharacterized protein F4813DRAFT_382839 [Daldinia decipiens]KAI1654249.1 hypothetical protein F4813DRAFT_382839 [Daldinia decipiens]
MYGFDSRTFLTMALAFSQVHASWSPITGHDFDFTAVYESGHKLTPSDPPKDVLSAQDILFERPAVVLGDPDTTGRNDRYIAFLEISYVPSIQMLDNIIYTFPWIKTNLIVTKSGTLSDELCESISISRPDYIPSSEVRNATMHVWKQNPELIRFIEEDNLLIFWQLARVWSNSTINVDLNFPRANVDFKVRNETGEFRGDVDENGAKIEGYVSTSTSAGVTAAPTDAPSTPTGSGSAPGSTTTGAGGPTETPNASSHQLISASWLMTVSGVLLLTSAIAAI